MKNITALVVAGFFALTTWFSLADAAPASAPHTFAIGEKDFLLDGKPLQIRCGEIHFARVPREYWKHRLQMAHAMGLNTVCVYLFWNLHEWKEGTYDWSGMADAAEFCRLAQQEGLWVILRPGPYSCAEWEMGGLPWWLVKHDGIQLRSKDPAFLAPATHYLKEVGRVLGPLQITKGGPLLMVQVENEYGSFGNDAEYMGALRQALIDGGFNVPLFACNPAGAIANGYREDLFQVVNFGRGSAVSSFEALRKIQKSGPLMNGEYYPGWFDMWGRPHHTGSIPDYLADLDYMLSNGMSFSIYMAHGGTSFGLWSGADRPFNPDTSSYDYDAPISEAGWVTEKFTRTREVVSKHLAEGEKLPDVPAANPVIAIAPFTLSEAAPIFANLRKAKSDDQPRTMEAYDQSRGCMVYRTTLPAGPGGALTVNEVHDFAWIFLDGKPAGAMDRRTKKYRVDLPARSKPMQLDVLLEAVGRVNFGREVFDRKGLHGPVQFTAEGAAPADLKAWQVYSLPLDQNELAALKFKKATAAVPAFWRGSFKLSATGDTFLDMHAWGKGVVWVNGHCLGRYWNIGPTQTMYLPGPWLRKGRNDVIVLDLLGPREPTLSGQTKPVLDELHPELDFVARKRAKGTFDVGTLTPVVSGSFTGEAEWQDAHFAAPATGRYLAFEALNSQDGTAVASIAELDAVNAKGEPVSKANWKILWVDSEDVIGTGNDAENILDGQPTSYWQTQYSEKKPDYPHRVVIDMGSIQEIAGIRYLARAGKAEGSGRIKDYRVFVSDTPFGLTAQ